MSAATMQERMNGAEAMEPENPQPLVREVSAGLPYPVAALGPLRAAVEAVQAMTLAPVAIPAQSALSVAALAVQAFANVETLGGDRPLSLYALTIAASGERKSSCDDKLMATMKEWEREQAKVVAQDRQAWENRHTIWKAQRDAVVAKTKTGKANQFDLDALGPEPTAPPSTDRLVTEPTYEGLTKLFAFGQPSLGLFSDEGGQFLGGFAMSQDNRQKTLAALNDLWMGNAIKRTRQGDGAFTLYGRRLSLHLMVQPVVAYSFMADPLAGDTGFLPRCLICEPASTIGTRLHDRSVRDDVPVQAFNARLRDILETPMPMDPETRELQPRRVVLSQEARQALIAYADRVERSQAPGGDCEGIKGTASKSAEQAARIAGVLTLWACLDAVVVSGRTMDDAIRLATFYLTEAQRLASVAVISASVAKAEKLRRWLLSDSWGKPWITIREILRGPLRERPEAQAAVAMLVEAEWLVALPKGMELDGMKRKEAWRVVPN
jgi:hypothetical protein